MLDLSLISGAAPAAAAAGRPPHAAGTRAADPASFIDALAQVAAFAAGDEPAAASDKCNLPVLEGGDGEERVDTDATADAVSGFDIAPVFDTVVDASPAVSPHHSTRGASDAEAEALDTTSDTRMDEAAIYEGAPAMTHTLPAAAGPKASAATDTPDTPSGHVASTPRDASVDMRGPLSPSPVSDDQSAAPADPTAKSPARPDRNAADRDATTTTSSPRDTDGSSTTFRIDAQRPKVHSQLSVSASDAAVRVDAEAAARAVRVGEATARVAAPDSSTPAPTTIPVDIVSGPTPGVASAAATEALAPASVSSGQQRQSSDAGETAHTYGVHAGPRLATPAGTAPVPVFTSLLTSSSTTDVLPAGTTTQIVQSIRLQMLRDGGEAHIRLDPRQFGDMTVRVKVEQGQVVARVEADAPVVREWLQSNQHVLRQSLAGQQLTLDRLEVYEPPVPSDRGRRDGEPGQGGQQDQPRQQRRQRQPTSEHFEVMA